MLAANASFSSFWSYPSSKDKSTADRKMIPLTSWRAALESSCLWTSWGLLVTDGPMELPLGPQPIRSCSCSQKATRPCRSRSGPKVCCHCSSNLTVSPWSVFGEVRGPGVLLAITAMPGFPAGPLPAHVCQGPEVAAALGAPGGREACASGNPPGQARQAAAEEGPAPFIIIEFCVFVYVRDKLDVFEGNLENYITYTNQTGILTPYIQQVQELISVAKGVWVVTILPASLTCVSYLFHILACYRKHTKRLWAGDKHFLPLKFRDPSPSESVAAIARYSGWQIAYILWGYLIIHVMQSLCGMMIMYGLVLPITHDRGLEMLRGLGLGLLTISIVVGLMILQVWIATSFFLQPKLGTDDKQKPLALNNRKAFHNFNYFLFFYNVLLGLGACLSRLLISCVLGTWLIARIDRTIMQSGYERADMGFSAWVGMLYVDHYHTNPVLVSFCHILITDHKERKLQKTTKHWCLGQSAGPHISARSRTRWLLLQTLINNPRLIILRKSKSVHGSQEFTQILLTCSDC
ncbi:PREDICTED: stimulated by retinoic acid gene 6 protein homolog isoform X6 [Chinchilla lanigera]|uniref:stimulated by retinoic acid gene 6 protein homolog isoform X6 n=1 Tax=Chinchilla lanigera TaxID=34839 RepID=UPI000696F4F2|nr:PREDICTED: stimulated by retinoic acid gene 6 protein homolog isoform X6 [Chinchilla lanigera]